MSGEARKGSTAQSSARDGDARDLQPATRDAAWNALHDIHAPELDRDHGGPPAAHESQRLRGLGGPLGSARAHALRISGPVRPTFPRRPLLLETDGIVT